MNCSSKLPPSNKPFDRLVSGHSTLKQDTVMADKPKLERIRLRYSPFYCVVMFAALIVGDWPSRVLGVGSRIPNQDAEAIGRGNAFAATADNPSALYYNPAGITQLEGNNVQLGALDYLGLYV